MTDRSSPYSKAELDAMELLAKGPHRLMVVMAPADASDEFMARLTTFSNFCLDVGLVPNVVLPALFKGMQAASCPFCDGLAGQNLNGHARGCKWRKAVERWGQAQHQIDQEFGSKHRGGWPGVDE